MVWIECGLGIERYLEAKIRGLFDVLVFVVVVAVVVAFLLGLC